MPLDRQDGQGLAVNVDRQGLVEADLPRRDPG